MTALKGFDSIVIVIPPLICSFVGPIVKRRKLAAKAQGVPIERGGFQWIRYEYHFRKR